MIVADPIAGFRRRLSLNDNLDSERGQRIDRRLSRKLGRKVFGVITGVDYFEDSIAGPMGEDIPSFEIETVYVAFLDEITGEPVTLYGEFRGWYRLLERVAGEVAEAELNRLYE